MTSIITVRYGAPATGGTGGSSSNHGTDLNAASQITIGVGKDFDVLGDASINFMSTDGRTIGDTVFFTLHGRPTFIHNASAPPAGFAALRLEASQNFQPPNADSCFIGFRLSQRSSMPGTSYLVWMQCALNTF